MKTFSREEQRLFIIAGACCVIASAVLLCLPEYWDKVPIARKRPVATTPGANPPTRLAPRPQKTRVVTNDSKISPVNPNFATYEELLAIPGIGPILARNILHHREDNLIFSANEMLRVRGIGKQKWKNLAPYFTFRTETTVSPKGER